MQFEIPADCPLPRPNWSWISPDDTTYPLDVAYNQSHENWVSKNLLELSDSFEESDSPDNILERMFNAGWIRRSGEIFQTSVDHAVRAKNYIDKHEALGKHFTIVSKFDDGNYYEIGTLVGKCIESTGGWTKKIGV